MNCDVPAPNVRERLVQDSHHTSGQTALDESDTHLLDLINQVSQLTDKAKVALIRKLIPQLAKTQIQAMLECGLQELADRQSTASVTRQTRLLLKKDYSYQDQGLSQPTQYYVYLRRRKPKLDRYIGTLFYIPQGCALSYFTDAEGRIMFNPPHNVFQLRDSTHPDSVRVVRLICLAPPLPDYTFTKEQPDTPEIYLHLEYLDPITYQPLSQEAYAFPSCMHEGGQLDRYRWDATIAALPEIAAMPPMLAIPPDRQTSVNNPVPIPSPLNTILNEATSLAQTTTQAVASHARPVLQLPTTKPVTLQVAISSDVDKIFKRMRLWVTWSEKAMPQAKWTLVQEGQIYTLMSARLKRRILQFDGDRQTVTLGNTLPVVMKWFHDLSLAVSQAHNQQHYSVAQLKLAHNLVVETNLPPTHPIEFFTSLFGVEFSPH